MHTYHQRYYILFLHTLWIRTVPCILIIIYTMGQRDRDKNREGGSGEERGEKRQSSSNDWLPVVIIVTIFTY